MTTSDNTDHDDLADFLAFLRTPSSSDTTCAIHSALPAGKVHRAHEISIRH
ncbi:hypothetical protein HNR46_003224 [Haloferula luteola]|uniref:Uncharacterized protein n=1 Tax=Haloferula luteola TaxID=595692 RepID=A0A840VBQ2_9BACT|nr:hypothetical protein [Haloferula luteola]MBB5352974.1 hypothetical protein [Haloferula luteola]